MKINYKLRYLKNIFLRSGFHYFRMAMVQPPYWLSVKGKTCRILAGNDSGSATCYREVIIDDCYDIFKYSKHYNPLVIADIGANVGMFSKLCSLLFPRANIYAYEPNQTALNWLEQNAQKTHIRVFPFAVSENSGTLMLDTQCDSTLGKISKNGNLSIQCIAASEVAEGNPIDLLKMDCEGSEWSILRDPSLLRRTQHFCLEYHLDDAHAVEELQDLIEKAGHQILRISPNENYDGQFGLLWSTRISRTRN